MRKIQAALVCAFACTAMAQIGSYMGPGVLSTGAGTIGQRSGAQVDLRFYADVLGVYDNGLQPFSVSPQGQLQAVNGLYGEQYDLGIYGQHAWKQALLGLNFSANYYRYENDTYYDGNGEFLNLGYTYQKSRRLIFNFRGIGGSTQMGYGAPGFYATPVEGAMVGQPSALLFDSRLYYVQGGADVTYILTPRTSFTVGGDGYTMRYTAAGLVGMNGYTARGSIQHRLSRTKTVGFDYQHIHYGFLGFYGQSDLNVGEAFYATSLGKRWTFYLGAGIMQSETKGVEQINLNPVIAALLGQSFGYQNFYVANYYPTGDARLTGKFKNSSITAEYSKFIAPGNGVYLTSRQDTGAVGYSYTGIRKWNFGISGIYYTLSGMGQTIPPYSLYGAGAGFTYNMTRSFHLIGRYDYRRVNIVAVGFNQNASRVTFGVGWSPGDVPLSLW